MASLGGRVWNVAQRLPVGGLTPLVSRFDELIQLT